MKGFREKYDHYDVEAACIHGNYLEEDVIFDHYKDQDPLEVLKTLGLNLEKLTVYHRGFGNDFSNEQLAKILAKVNESKYSYWVDLLSAHDNNELPPVIIIRDELCDGAHRCIIQYAKGQLVPCAIFKLNY